MATVVESLRWEDHRDDFEAVAGVQPYPDNIQEAFFNAAKERADHYLNNPFVDEATGADLPIPSLVVVGVYRLAAAYMDRAAQERRGLKSITNRDISMVFAEVDEEINDILLTHLWPAKSLRVF